MIKLIEVLPADSDLQPQVKTESRDLALKMLRKSKNWTVHPDENYEFIDGDIYEKGKAPNVEKEGVLLLSIGGQERFEKDIALAEKMLKKSFRKKTWVISPKEKKYKFDEKSMVIVKAAKNNKAPKQEKPEDNKE